MVAGQFVRHGVGRACSDTTEPTRRLEAMGCAECRLMCEAAHEASSLDHWHSCAAFQCADRGGHGCALWDELPVAELDTSLLKPANFTPALQCWRRLRELDNTSLQIPSDWPPRHVLNWAVSKDASSGPTCNLRQRRQVRLVTWHELPAACTRVRRFRFPEMALEFDRAALPRLSGLTPTACSVVELAFPGNTRPPVNRLDFYGEQLTVQGGRARAPICR